MDNEKNIENCYKVFILFIVILFFVYFIFTFKHILIQLCCSKKRQFFIVYWFDLLFMIITFLILSITFLLFIFLLNKLQLTYFENFLPIIFSGNFFMNIILSIYLINFIYKIKKIQINEIFPIDLINFIDKNDVMSLYSIFSHLIINILIIFCEVLFIIFFYSKIYDLSKYINLVQGILCLLQCIFIKILYSKYVQFSSKNIYSHNISNEKIYNITKQKILILSEHLINKSIYDIVLNIPTMIRFSMDCSFLKIDNQLKEKFTMMCLFIFDIFFSYIYLILLGSMLLRIDKNNKISVTQLMKILYFLCWFKSIMGIKNDDTKLFKPIIIDNKKNSILDNINSDDDSYLNEKEQHLLNAIIKNNLNLDLNNENDDFPQSEFLNKKIFEKVIYKSEKEYLPSSIFIIYKLLFLYFKSNINVYKNVEKTIEDEGIPFQKVIDNNKINKSNIKDLNLIKERISRLSRISFDNREKIIPFKKFELKQLMNSLDDKIIKEDFIKYIIKDNEDNINKNEINNNENKENRNLSINSNYDNYEFLIESLLNEYLFELYPFYQISINDILNSLEIGNNKDLLNLFFENRIKNNSFNTYYTSDSFLTFEIYDNNSILYSQLKNFISNYKNYLIEKISNFSFTFLPLLLGIYNIKYSNYNKIIFLYRNPLAFTPFINFKNWINFTFNDGNEIKDISTTNTGILDINEIEVKNNIELEDDEYNETIKILKEDMEFLKTQNFELNFNLNLIVVNDVKKKFNDFPIDDNINYEIDTSKNLNINQSANQNQENNNKNDLDNMIRDSSLFRDSILMSMKNFKKYYGSEVVSLLEKLYNNNVVGNLYIFKIYFTEIFKKKKRIISKENLNNNNLDNSNSISIQNCNSLSLDENEIRENNKKYCNFLKTKLLRKIRKSNNSFLNSFDNKFQMAIQEN